MSEFELNNLHYMKNEILHVYPLYGKEHITSGGSCWCNPRIETPCPECNEDAHILKTEDGSWCAWRPDEPCFKCDSKGYLPVEVFDPNQPCMVIHKAREE